MTKSDHARALAALRKTYAGGRPKILKRCPRCKALLDARERSTYRCEASE